VLGAVTPVWRGTCRSATGRVALRGVTDALRNAGAFLPG
jgi:hypothetical protein